MEHCTILNNWMPERADDFYIDDKIHTFPNFTLNTPPTLKLIHKIYAFTLLYCKNYSTGGI